MSNFLASVLVAGLLVTASMAPKLWLQQRAAQADTDRLNQEIIDRLKATGFEAWTDPTMPVVAVRAQRSDCRLIAWNADRARELGVIFSRAAIGYRPIQIGYRGRWSEHPAGAQAVMERFGQDGAARVGFNFARPAVIGLASVGPCNGLPRALDDLFVHSFVTHAD